MKTIPYEPDSFHRDHGAPLTVHQEDRHGFTPSPELIGTVLTHTGTGFQYIVTDITWLGDTDEWGFVARQLNMFGVTITRPFSHLHGVRSNGERRYEEWRDFEYYGVAFPTDE